MNVFILNTGRCGSTTWIKACRHIDNYSAAHESRAHLIGEQRLAYPCRHIEADNRLSWLLGRLHQRFGDDAFYVHLTRAPDLVVQSFSRRAAFGIMRAYRDGVLLNADADYRAEDIAHDYLDTVEGNIRLFLEHRPNKMQVRLEAAREDFKRFWNAIGAEGDLSAALVEFDHRYNASAAG